MKQVFKKLALFILGIIMVLTPFGIFAIIAKNQKAIYSKTYYAALVDKVNYLESIKNDKKIILIGGSNVAFGFNSELIEKEFPEYKVANFGLYAMLGTKIMLDLALDYVGKDDMVFVIPEINEQSTSLYFNANATLKATEEKISIWKKLPKDNRHSLYGEYFSFVGEKGKYKKLIDPGETVYRRDSFNSRGDISYIKVNENGETTSLRTQNIMKGKRYIDPRVSYVLSKESNDFFNYLNNYYLKIKKKSANLYYAFCPVNDLANTSSNEEMVKYYWSIRQCLAFDVIGSPLEYIIDPHYFYDTNFHLNDTGSILRTYYFVEDIYRDILHKNSLPSFSIPERPDYPPIDAADEEDSESASFFNLEKNETGYSIVDLKEDYCDLEEIRLPQIYNHQFVTILKSKAFAKSHSLKKIAIPNSYVLFENGSFDDCLTLESAYLETTVPSTLSVDFSGGLINNVNTHFRIYVPSQSLASYKTDYNWQFYRDYLEGYDYEESV